MVTTLLLRKPNITHLIQKGVLENPVQLYGLLLMEQMFMIYQIVSEN